MTKTSRFAFLPVALIVALMFAIAGCGGDDGGTTTGGDGGATQTQSDTGGEESGADGAKVFTDAGCAGCHTLAAANASGKTGPSLDETKPDKALVVDRVTNGKGAMPALKGQLSDEEIEAVAVYVSDNAGK